MYLSKSSDWCLVESSSSSLVNLTTTMISCRHYLYVYVTWVLFVCVCKRMPRAPTDVWLKVHQARLVNLTTTIVSCRHYLYVYANSWLCMYYFHMYVHVRTNTYILIGWIETCTYFRLCICLSTFCHWYICFCQITSCPTCVCVYTSTQARMCATCVCTWKHSNI